MRDLTLKESRSIPLKIREKLEEFDICFASQLIAMTGIDAEKKRLAKILKIGVDNLQKMVKQIESEFSGKQRIKTDKTSVKKFIQQAGDKKKELPECIKNLPPASRRR